jgi:hypothetical protein
MSTEVMFAGVERYALLRTFRSLFQGKQYNHRNSTLGDIVASQLYEDLVELARSTKLAERVHNHSRVVNLGNKTVGKISRRGGGTFGELVPTATALSEAGLLVARGEIANIEIGAETKILAKAMIKQIDRVIGDLVRQVDEFRRTGGNPICVGIVGIIHASSYTSYEGKRSYLTTAKGGTNIPHRKRPRLKRESSRVPLRHSMNSSFCNTVRAIRRHIPLSGQNTETRKSVTPRFW